MNNRRKFLAALGAGCASAIAGCTTNRAGQDEPLETATPIPTPNENASERYRMDVTEVLLRLGRGQESNFHLSLYYDITDRETGDLLWEDTMDGGYILPGFDIEIEYKPVFEPEGETQQTETIHLSREDIQDEYRPDGPASWKEYRTSWKVNLDSVIDASLIELGSYDFDEVMGIRVRAKFSDSDDFGDWVVSRMSYWVTENPMTGKLQYPIVGDAVEDDGQYHVPIHAGSRGSHPYKGTPENDVNFMLYYAEWISFDTGLFEASRKTNDGDPLKWREYDGLTRVRGYTPEHVSYFDLPLTDDIAQIFKNMVDRAKIAHPGMLAEFVQAHTCGFDYVSDLYSMSKETYIRHPAELLVDGEGDCTDFTFYQMTLFAKLGFNTSLIVGTNRSGGPIHTSSGISMPKEFEPEWADSEAPLLNYTMVPPDVETERVLYVECVTAMSIGRYLSAITSTHVREVINPDRNIYLADPVGEHKFQYDAPTDLLW